MMNIINTKAVKTLSLFLLLFGFSIHSVNAHEAVSVKSIFDVLNYQELVDVRLQLDLKMLEENRRNDDHVDALLSFEDENGMEQRWNIKATVRGKFRKNKMPGKCLH